VRPPGGSLKVRVRMRDKDGHRVGKADPGEDAGDDGGGAKHARGRRVPRLDRSGKRETEKLEVGIAQGQLEY
jgi:hypothetical protein